MAWNSCGMTYRIATLDDVGRLARWNRQLVEDEGHRSHGRPIHWFEARMRALLASGYVAVLFESVGYRLYSVELERTANDRGPGRG